MSVSEMFTRRVAKARKALGTVGAYQQSRLMFRPTGTDAVHADASEIERMALRFTDARQQTWEKIGSQPVRPVVS